MLIELYVVLLVLTLGVITYGLHNKSDMMYSIIGFTFLFVLGILLMTEGVTHVSGYNITTVNSSLDVVTSVTEPYSDSSTAWFGRFMAVGSFLGFALTFFEYRKGRKSDED